MAFQRVKKMLGISAVVICCGTVMFTFTGCENKQPVAETVQMQEVQDDLAEKDGGAIANDIDLTQSEVEAESREDITVYYDQCATTPDTLTMVNGEQVDYKVKDYVAPNFFEYMQGLDYNYEVNEDDGYVANDSNIVSDNYEITEDGKLLVRDMKMDVAIPVVKYVRTSPDEVEPRYIGLVPNDSKLVSGITFVMEKNDDGYYKLTGMRGVFDEDITGLGVYEGTFNGWAMESQGAVVYEVDDEIKISGNLNLFPHFLDNEVSKLAADDGTVPEGQIEEIDGKVVLRVIHIKSTKTDKDGNTVESTKYALAGLDAKKDTVKTKDGKTVDKDKVEKQQTEDKVPEAKPQPAKKKEETQPGQPKPESAKKESPAATDNTNHDPDFDTPSAADWSAAGWGELDPGAVDAPVDDPYDLHFE